MVHVSDEIFELLLNLQGETGVASASFTEIAITASN
jgi:hypothetical protein